LNLQISTPRKISRISEDIWRLEKIFIDIAHYLARKLTASAEKAVYKSVFPTHCQWEILHTTFLEHTMVEKGLITLLLVAGL